MNHVKKIQDPQKLQERTEAQELVKSVVTRRRVEKELYKMRDEIPITMLLMNMIL